MRRLAVALIAVGLVTARTAGAEPISVNLDSSNGGFSQVVPGSLGWFAIDLGTLQMPASSDGFFLVDGLKHGSDYTVTFNVSGIANWDILTAEVLDPIDDGDDAIDPVPPPSYVPAGFSTSNKMDGFSFAQGSGLERSAVFASGAANLDANENSNFSDMLIFSGLTGADTARVTFGLRDRLGDRGFLLRLSASPPLDSSQVPEPASMLLIGTGLAGMAAARRRRSQSVTTAA